MSTPGTINFPTSLDDSTSLFEVANRARTTLASTLSSGATSASLTSGALFPSSGAITIDNEIIYYTGKSTNTLTGLIRGRQSTSAASHSSGTSVKSTITKGHYEALRDAIITLETNVVDKVNIQTGIAGAKTFTGVMTHIQAPAADGAQGSSALAGILRGAYGTNATPITAETPATYLQDIKSGGTNGTASFGFLYNFQTKSGVASAADYYPHYLITRFPHSMTGTPSPAAYNYEGSRVYLYASPTGITGQLLHFYANTVQAERTVSGVRIIGYYSEPRNSAGTDAAVANNSIDTTFGMTISPAGNAHNTTGIFFEGSSNTTSLYAGMAYAANSLCQRALDFTDTTFTLQGTAWTATAASNQVTIASGGHAAVEVIAGDWIKVNGVYCKVASATANAITLTGIYSSFGGAGTPVNQTITKSVQPLWMANQSFISALNAAGTARYALAGLTSGDAWSFDLDGRGSIFGGTITGATLYGGSAAGSTLSLNGTSHGTPAAAHVFINPLVGATTPGTTFIGANASSPTVAGVNNVLHLQGTETQITAMAIDTYAGSNATGSALVFRTARNTAASPTASQLNDAIAAFGGRPYNTTTSAGFTAGNRAALILKCAENITDVAQGMYVSIEGTPRGTTSRTQRELVGLDKTLTDAATSLYEVALADGKMAGGTIIWTIVVADATPNYQVLSGITTFAIINKGGAYTKTFTNNTSNDAKAVTSGTLTCTWSGLDGTNKVTIQITPAGSLTETTYKLYYQVINNSPELLTLL